MESPTVVKPVQMDMLEERAAVIPVVGVTARCGCQLTNLWSLKAV
jgi:hypothetical protein